jgi:hypothetical protein
MPIDSITSKMVSVHVETIGEKRCPASIFSSHFRIADIFW